MHILKWMEINRYNRRQFAKESGIKYQRLCAILSDRHKIELSEVIKIDYFTRGEVTVDDWLDFYWQEWAFEFAKPRFKRMPKVFQSLTRADFGKVEL